MRCSHDDLSFMQAEYESDLIILVDTPKDYSPKPFI